MRTTKIELSILEGGWVSGAAKAGRHLATRPLCHCLLLRGTPHAWVQEKEQLMLLQVRPYRSHACPGARAADHQP